VHEPLEQHADEERDADDAVHREERRVEPREVVRPDERMLVDEKPRGEHHAHRVERARVRAEARRTHRREKHDRGDMQPARDQQRSLLAERRRQRVQPLFAVECDVL
jgi:hypothetical protein